MTPEDLAALHRRCFTMPRPWSAAEFATLLAAPRTLLCSAAEGFLLGRLAGEEAEILTLAVAPECRRRGIGRMLVRDFEARAARAGGSEVFLEVAEDNSAAQALYEGLGYRRAGCRPGYYPGARGGRIAALVLRHRLAPRKRPES